MIAIDMPMPKSCVGCPCYHDVACYAEGERKEVMLTYKERHEKREQWCPLIDLTQYEDDGK